MGFFSRLTNLAKGSWHAKTSSRESSLTEEELEAELRTVRPEAKSLQSSQSSLPENNTPETEESPASAERDADGNVIKTL